MREKEDAVYCFLVCNTELVCSLWASASYFPEFKLTAMLFGLDSLCAGSLLLFSMWAPIFQDSLGFSQMQINAVSIAGALGMYLPYVHLSPLSS